MADGAAFRMTRKVDAPRDEAWRAFTERDRLMRWFGPAGFEMRAAAVDLRPDGVFHYCLASADGVSVWGKWTYRSLRPPEEFVAVVSFSDERGGVTRHPMSPMWPLETLSTIRFRPEGDDATMIEVVWAPINETPEERASFAAGHAEMRQGWGGTFDRLDAYLARV